MQQRVRAGEQLVFSGDVHGPDELDVYAIEMRFDPLLKIGCILNNARNDQRPAAEESHFNGQVDALIGVNPAEKNQVAAAPLLKGIQRQVDSVVDRRHVVQPGIRSELLIETKYPSLYLRYTGRILGDENP